MGPCQQVPFFEDDDGGIKFMKSPRYPLFLMKTFRIRKTKVLASGLDVEVGLFTSCLYEGTRGYWRVVGGEHGGRTGGEPVPGKEILLLL